MKISFSVENDNRKTLATDSISAILAVLDVASNGLLAFFGEVASRANFIAGTPSTFLIDHPSVTVPFNGTSGSTPYTKSGSGTFNHYGSRRKISVKRVYKRMKKPGRTGCRSKAISSFSKTNVRIAAFAAVALTTSASIAASSTHELLIVVVHKNGTPTISLLFSSGQKSSSNASLVLFLYVK